MLSLFGFLYLFLSQHEMLKLCELYIRTANAAIIIIIIIIIIIH